MLTRNVPPVRSVTAPAFPNAQATRPDPRAAGAAPERSTTRRPPRPGSLLVTSAGCAVRHGRGDCGTQGVWRACSLPYAVDLQQMQLLVADAQTMDVVSALAEALDFEDGTQRMALEMIWDHPRTEVHGILDQNGIPELPETFVAQTVASPIARATGLDTGEASDDFDDLPAQSSSELATTATDVIQEGPAPATPRNSFIATQERASSSNTNGETASTDPSKHHDRVESVRQEAHLSSAHAGTHASAPQEGVTPTSEPITHEPAKVASVNEGQRILPSTTAQTARWAQLPDPIIAQRAAHVLRAAPNTASPSSAFATTPTCMRDPRRTRLKPTLVRSTRGGCVCVSSWNSNGSMGASLRIALRTRVPGTTSSRLTRTESPGTSNSRL
ncbi:hypothetical protein HNR42_002856 [Deinobacterium chartae]|uniref:Uncharacterized protein n=1 Tax=Deinobacterium chartae TaxID=521158 RepID=A0A841I6E5_9DEIO|nr:hypothetical protein [Deinobacterium chartae]